MTCADIHAMKGRGTQGVTSSLLVAMLRHMANCPACCDMIQEGERGRSPEQRDVDNAFALAAAPAVIRAAMQDPEVMP